MGTYMGRGQLRLGAKLTIAIELDNRRMTVQTGGRKVLSGQGTQHTGRPLHTSPGLVLSVSEPVRPESARTGRLPETTSSSE